MAEEMKGAGQRIKYPGQGNTRRELVQRSDTPRSVEGATTSAPCEFHLMWLMVSKTRHEDVLAKLYGDKIEFFTVSGDHIDRIYIKEVESVKV